MHGTVDLSEALAGLIDLIRREVDLFSHIDPSRTLVCIGSNRNTGRGGGVYGKLLPLKFENGSDSLSFRGRIYTMPEIMNKGVEQLYIIYFYMTRFFDLPPMEKLNVVFHELYHISPDFNGDIRRLAAVKSAHGHSKKYFDMLYRDELRKFMELIRGKAVMEFLKLDSKDLYRKFSRVKGLRMKRPRPFTSGPD